MNIKISYFSFSFKVNETKKVPLKNMVWRGRIARKGRDLTRKMWRKNVCGWVGGGGLPVNNGQMSDRK